METMRKLQTAEERAYYALNAKVWSILAPFYDWMVLPFTRLRRRVAALVHPDASSTILDVATGTGAQALAFGTTGARVHGVDLSEAMLRQAREKNPPSNVQFSLADATDLPFQRGSFDVSCISFALHEMPASVRQRALREMVRVTRPTGKIVVVDYGLPSNALAAALVYRFVKLYERDHYADFVREDLRTMLADAGVEVGQLHSALLGVARIAIGAPAPSVAASASSWPPS